jgi:archaellum component FlaC
MEIMKDLLFDLGPAPPIAAGTAIRRTRTERDQGQTPKTANSQPKTKARTGEQAAEPQKAPEAEMGAEEAEAEEAIPPQPDPASGLTAAMLATIGGMMQKAVEEGNARFLKRFEDILLRVGERIDGFGDALDRVRDRLTALEKEKGRVAGIQSVATKANEAVASVRIEVKKLEKKMEDDCSALDGEVVKQAAACMAVTQEQSRMQQQVTDLNARMAELTTEHETERAGLRAELQGSKAELQVMQDRLAAMEASLAGRHGGAVGGQGGAEMHGSPPSAASTVEAAMRSEAEVASRKLKLVGLVQHKGREEEKRSQALLCQEAGEVLGRMVGGGVRIEVEQAFWQIKAPLTPMLVVTLRTHAMASDVRALRGGEGKRITQWWGPVEKAVRDVLYKEREATLARDPQAQVRVQGSRLWVGGVQRALSQEAVTAGMSVITRPRPNGPARGARPPPHTAGRQQHTGVNQQRRNN